jgi:hypothetical protein
VFSECSFSLSFFKKITGSTINLSSAPFLFFEYFNLCFPFYFSLLTNFLLFSLSSSKMLWFILSLFPPFFLLWLLELWIVWMVLGCHLIFVPNWFFAVTVVSLSVGMLGIEHTILSALCCLVYHSVIPRPAENQYNLLYTQPTPLKLPWIL